MEIFARIVVLPNWPDWCWCPLSGAYAIVSGGGPNRVDIQNMSDVGILAALSAWRITQGIYRVDPDVFDALWETPIAGRLPIDLFYRLPEWCVYVETPRDSKAQKAGLLGFFAHLEWDVHTKRTELRFVIDSTEKGLQILVIHLVGETIEECVNAAIEEMLLRLSDIKDDITIEEREYVSDILSEEYPDDYKVAITPIVSVLLYICSISADIADMADKRLRPANPQPRKTKKGPRIFPPNSPTTWLVGYRIGATLRLASTTKDNKPSEGTHVSPRPHVRCAHWHSFWIGPKNRPGKRRLVVKWLHPVLVGAGEIVPTIRQVGPGKKRLTGRLPFPEYVVLSFSHFFLIFNN